MGGIGFTRSARRARAALTIILGLVAFGVVGCGGSGPADTGTGAPLPSSPTGSVMVRIPSNVPDGALTFRIRALQVGTDTDAAPPAQVPLGQGQPATASILVPVGTMDFMIQALDSVGRSLAGRKVRVTVRAGSLQEITLALVPSQPVLVALPDAARLDVLDKTHGTLQASISLADMRPETVAFAPGGAMAFTTDVTQRLLIPVDMLFGQALSATLLSGVPQRLAIPTAGTTGYVSLQQVSGTADAIASFSLADGRVLGTTTIDTGGNPSLSALALTPDGTQVLDLWQPAPALTSQAVMEVRRAADMTVVSSTPLTAGARVGLSRLAVSTDGTLAAFTFQAPETPSSTLGITSVGTVGPVMGTPADTGTWIDMAFTSGTSLVALNDQGSVSFIDAAGYPTTSVVEAELTLPGPAVAMAVDRATSRLWVTLLDGSFVVYDLTTRGLVLSGRLGQTPAGIAVW